MARVHKQRQARVQKREQRVERRNAGGTASTHHAACSRPLHKRPCRLAARANERFYNSMQKAPSGYLSLPLSLSLLSLCYTSPPSLFTSSPFNHSRALLRPRRMFLSLARGPVVAVYVRYHSPSLSFHSLPSRTEHLYSRSLFASLDVRKVIRKWRSRKIGNVNADKDQKLNSNYRQFVIIPRI